MTEAYTLFDSICNLRWFANVSSILFLNKTDLLKKKLEKTQLKDWCPDYEGKLLIKHMLNFKLTSANYFR
jgi:guanine nucleotide-binding protein subunit alpha